MKTDYEIYQEWHLKEFGFEAFEEDHIDTKICMDSISFQLYLLGYRKKELADLLFMYESIAIAWIKNKVDFIKKYFNKFIGRRA